MCLLHHALPPFILKGKISSVSLNFHLLIFSQNLTQVSLQSFTSSKNFPTHSLMSGIGCYKFSPPYRNFIPEIQPSPSLTKPSTRMLSPKPHKHIQLYTTIQATHSQLQITNLQTYLSLSRYQMSEHPDVLQHTTVLDLVPISHET